MTFIIILFALVIERFFDCTHLRKWQWFNRYQTLLLKKLGYLPPLVLFVITITPLLVLVGMVDFLLKDLFFHFFKLMFGAFILIYSLGPHNFWASIYGIIKTLHIDDPAIAKQKMEALFPTTTFGTITPFHESLIHFIFVEANRRVFAVFFWFIVLGPVGALLYRLTDLCKHEGITTQSIARDLQDWLDWLPVRVFSFLFALAGHFTDVIKPWRAGIWKAPIVNDTYLTSCGVAALDVGTDNLIPEDGSAEKEALALLDRTYVIALVALALVVLII